MTALENALRPVRVALRQPGDLEQRPRHAIYELFKFTRRTTEPGHLLPFSMSVN